MNGNIAKYILSCADGYFEEYLKNCDAEKILDHYCPTNV